MEMTVCGFVSIIFASLVAPVSTYLTCSLGTYCDAPNAYCCGFLNEQCCFYEVYEIWWFWFIWFIVLVFIASCSFWCYRRRRLRAQYYVLGQNGANTYGTTWSSSTVVAQGTPYPAQPTPYPVGAPQYPAQASAAPPVAPAYQPSEKPPAYSPY